MSEYATLKSTIEDNIKQNGTNAITGPVLQSALLAMVNSLGAEFQFGGVAAPTDNPGTPDYKVAYIASNPGTYSNFGGITLADGEVAILLWSGSAWSKQTTGISAMFANPDTINGGIILSKGGDIVAHAADNDEMQEVRNALVDADFALLNPDAKITNKVINDDGPIGSTSYDVWVYALTPGKNYVFSAILGSGIDRRPVYYSADADGNELVGWDKYKGDAAATSEQYFSGPLTIPAGANYILLNVRHLAVWESNYNVRSIDRNPLIKVRDLIPASIKDTKRLKCVVKDDGTFYVRFHLSATQDAILTFACSQPFNYDANNCMMQDKFYIGAPTDADETILATQAVHDCHDSQGPIFTANFGPMFSNHGYCTPRVRVPGNGLGPADIGSEWVDNNDFHYTLGHIDTTGEWLYLLPVINTTGGPGHETREWISYASPYPEQLTRVTPGGETLVVTQSARYDYQISELAGKRILIGGNPVGPGVYYCDEITLSYRQIGYNPVDVTAWWPRPVTNGVMLYFDRNFTICGGRGVLSLTVNTSIDVRYPFPLARYDDVQPMFPFQVGNFVPYIYIPKLKKHTQSLDFREEFASPDNATLPATNYVRNSADLVDVDDLPDRAYCYLKDGNGDVLFACAGGHSLVRGMSIKSVRNEHVAVGDVAGNFSPPSGNKFYPRVLVQMGTQDNIVPTSFVGTIEGYMCWYLPKDGVHTFFHKTKDGYAVYIHVNTTQEKGVAQLQDFMNDYEVAQTIEKTDGISLLTNTVIDGKLFFTSDSSEQTYNYIVVLLK